MFFKKNENQNPQGEEENNSTEVVTVAEVTGKAENETVDTIEDKPEEQTTEKVEDKPEEQTTGKVEEKPEGQTAGKVEEKPEGQTAGKVEDKPEEQTTGKVEEKPEERTTEKVKERPEEQTTGKVEDKPEEQTTGKVEDKPEEQTTENIDEKMKEKKKISWKIIVPSIIALLLVVALLTTSIIFYQDKVALQKTLKDTQTELESTSKELNARIEAEKDKTFDYLAIGNSITQHPVVEDLWWGEWGMAASDEEHDFYHLVTKAIEGKYKSTSSNVLNYTIWESPYYDRQHTLKFLDGYLNEDLDFITIDLGENCIKGNDQSSEEFQEELTRDYADLVDYIAEKCPKAKIVMIGCYWERPESDAAKQVVCQDKKIDYIDLSSIRGSEYRVGERDVQGADGQTHTIDVGPVAEHPGDLAMQYIADQVVSCLPETWEPEK